MSADNGQETKISLFAFIDGRGSCVRCFETNCVLNSRIPNPLSLAPERAPGTIENLVAQDENLWVSRPVNVIYCTSPDEPHLRRTGYDSGTCSGLTPKDGVTFSPSHEVSDG